VSTEQSIILQATRAFQLKGNDKPVTSLTKHQFTDPNDNNFATQANQSILMNFATAASSK
jgi:hypothetical protein